MSTFDVRRFAALDLHGANGSVVRRRVVVTEFALSAGLGIGLSAFALGSLSPMGLLSLCILGIGLNYAALAVHAVALARGGRLARELSGVDVPRALRSATLMQVVLLVPYAVFVLAIRQCRHRTA